MVPGTWYQAPGARYLLPGTRPWVPGTITRYLEPGTRHQAPGNTVPGTTYQAPSQVSGTTYEAPGTGLRQGQEGLSIKPKKVLDRVKKLLLHTILVLSQTLPPAASNDLDNYLDQF